MALIPPTEEELRRRFDSAAGYTVGLEEEVMLLDPETFELAPCAPELVERLGDRRFKLELPAAQLEIVTEPLATVGEAIAALRRGREDLQRGAATVAVPAGAGVHPFSAGPGELNTMARYREIIAEYGEIARRQLVFAGQVHVAVGPADRALAVYNAARSYLPLIAALAANAPFYEGRDSGLASVRPKLAELLPRQGVPPALTNWGEYAEAFRWGAAAGGRVLPRTWWWELRPHTEFGTLEFRVPDTQSRLSDAAAVAALIQSLVAWLAERYEAGEELEVASSWRIEENRWSAARDGVEGRMADLRTGEPRWTGDWLSSLVEALLPTASRLGCAEELRGVGALIEVNGAVAQRRAAAELGVRGLGPWLASRFLES